MAIHKEVTLVLKEKIGDVTYELEAKRGHDKVEISARQDDGKLELLENIDIYDLGALAYFFERCRIEVEKLNDGVKP